MRLTLCGSRKFEPLFHEWTKTLTLCGHVVYELAIYGTRNEDGDENISEAEKHLLDMVHFAKIDNSDGIVVLNQGGYIGQSTEREIKWARMKGKNVYAIDPEMNPEYTLEPINWLLA